MHINFKNIKENRFIELKIQRRTRPKKTKKETKAGSNAVQSKFGSYEFCF